MAMRDVEDPADGGAGGAGPRAPAAPAVPTAPPPPVLTGTDTPAPPPIPSTPAPAPVIGPSGAPQSHPRIMARGLAREAAAAARPDGSSLPLALPGSVAGGTFALPGSRGSVPFRTPNFGTGRGAVNVGGGPGAPVLGADSSLSGGSAGFTSRPDPTDDDLISKIVLGLQRAGG